MLFLKFRKVVIDNLCIEVHFISCRNLSHSMEGFTDHISGVCYRSTNSAFVS
jgi:hypothetical protein